MYIIWLHLYKCFYRSPCWCIC